MRRRTAAIAVRVPEDVKAAAEKAALDDHRTISSLVEKLLTEWLASKSYLSTGHEERANG